jgi:hypothetical protein
MTRRKQARGWLGRGALAALLLHAQLLIPLIVLTFIYAAREEAQRAEEVDLAFRAVDADELPADLPSLEDLSKVTPPVPERTPPEKRRERLKVAPQQKPVAQAPAKPEREVPRPPTPPMPQAAPPPPPPPEERRAHEKMVDQDNDKDVPPPDDAKFLAQKNNRVAVETRATDTNLEKAQKGKEGSEAPSSHDDPAIGEEKTKIAELKEQKSAEGRKAPEVTPHERAELSEEDPRPARDKSLLALRDPAPRQHELTPETVDPSLPRTPDGDVVLPQNKQMRGPPKDASALTKGQRMKLHLNGRDYEYLFGADAAAERRLAQTERSHKQGKFQKRLGRVQSALENFIPEVKPGNQTALNTRAAPFAAFIARMHRSIHKLWGFGILEDWDEKPGSNPYNNQDLLTTLELVLTQDGSIDKVTVVRPSGYLPYDVAAIDVAYSAGPYPDPPRQIRSANGKIYIHWRFYRDGRQCATSGVDYFILNNAPAGGDQPAVGDGQPAAPHEHAGGEPHQHEGEGTAEERPRQLEREERRGDGRERRARAVQAGAGESAAATTPNVPRADDPRVRRVADAWFASFARGDVPAMVGAAGYPFRSGDGVAATASGALTSLLTGLVDETSERSGTGHPQLFTRASLRGLVGKLPGGLEDDPGLLFAVGQVSRSDALILILAERSGIWKAVGLVRR